jgi:hypothetical protein
VLFRSIITTGSNSIFTSAQFSLSNNIACTGKISTNNQVLGYANDTSNAPAFSWTDDSNTGMYHPAADALALVTGGAERMRVLSTGNIGIGTSNPSYRLHVDGSIYSTGDIIAFSDIRLKSHIIPIEDALDKLHQLNGYTFNTTLDDKRHTGLIAQEVLEVLPEAVYKDEAIDEGYYSVAYGNMAGLFVEAIKAIDMKYQQKMQYLQEQIDVLKALVGST